MLFTTYLYKNIKNEIDNIQTKDKNILMLLKAFVRAYLKKFFKAFYILTYSWDYRGLTHSKNPKANNTRRK